MNEAPYKQMLSKKKPLQLLQDQSTDTLDALLPGFGIPGSIDPWALLERPGAKEEQSL